MKFESDEVAEAIFRFMSNKDIFDDYCVKLQMYDYSMAEYVSEFCYMEFCEYCHNELGFDIE